MKKKNTRDYGKPRVNFEGGGNVGPGNWGGMTSAEVKCEGKKSDPYVCSHPDAQAVSQQGGSE